MGRKRVTNEGGIIMKRFEYSMQRLLDAREASEHAAKSALEGARIDHKQQCDKQDVLMARRTELIEQSDGERCTVGASQIAEVYAYLGSLDRRIDSKACDIRDTEAIVHSRQVALSEAVDQRRKLEKLRDREMNVWEHGRRREDQIMMDEVASISNQRDDASRAA
jgi:flagellar export protein FliJ